MWPWKPRHRIVGILMRDCRKQFRLPRERMVCNYSSDLCLRIFLGPLKWCYWIPKRCHKLCPEDNNMICNAVYNEDISRMDTFTVFRPSWMFLDSVYIFNSIKYLKFSCQLLVFTLAGYFCGSSPLEWYFHNEPTRLCGDTPVFSVPAWNGPFSPSLWTLWGSVPCNFSTR